MGEYFLGISLTVLLGGMILSLLPDANQKPYLRLICGAAVVISILSPISSIIGDFFDKSTANELLTLFESSAEGEQNYDEIYNNTILSVGAEEASKRLESEIIQALTADDDGFDVSIIVVSNGDEICISHVEVIIHPSGFAINPHEIEKYVLQTLGCDCVIVYK